MAQLLSVRTLVPVLLCLISGVTLAGEEAHVLPLYAEPAFKGLPVTNSMIMVWLAAAIIIIFCRMATKQMQLVPAGMQNFAEWVFETLYNFLEGILGKDVCKRTFWFFATIFLMILVCNWSGLVPGMGTIGRIEGGHYVPFLRGANADLNMTAGMAFTFALLWVYWSVQENGIKGFLAHIFAPKGNFNGFMKLFMIFIFFAVGLLEVVSIAMRPIALSFRLYGNIFAGENILESMMQAVPPYLAWLPPMPFYFLEVLVGFIQALVFMLLTAVFLKLMCDHGDEHDEEHAH
jgi:F-type H+-transporting ATPase subunit a